MVRIRLKRIGRKHQPHYRIVVTDSRSPRDGRFIAEIGWFDPRSATEQIKIDGELAKSWIAKGAQPSDTVWGILAKAGVIEKTPQTSTRPPLKVRKPEKRRSTRPKEAAAAAPEAAPAEQKKEEAKA